MTNTQADIDELIQYLDDPSKDIMGDRSVFLTEDQLELTIDALVFYKEGNTY